MQKRSLKKQIPDAAAFKNAYYLPNDRCVHDWVVHGAIPTKSAI